MGKFNIISWDEQRERNVNYVECLLQDFPQIYYVYSKQTKHTQQAFLFFKLFK